MNLYQNILKAFAASAVIAGMTLSASAGTYIGVETTALSGQTGTTTGGTFLGATITDTMGGGVGVLYDTRTHDVGEGVAFTEADVDGNMLGLVATPSLRASSTAATSETGSQSYAGALVPYQYNGAVPALITFTYHLTADLNEPDPATTAAFVRARGGFILDPEFFATSANEYAESSTPAVDSFNFTSNVDGPVDQSDLISFIANPGDVFHLALALTTQAGHTPAFSDASSTLTGALTSDSGSITLVPEPTSSLLLMIGLGTISLFRRRRA